MLPLILLLIELIDELIGSVREAAWPLIRADLNLSYTQIGLLLSLPGILGVFIEPLLGIFADMGKKRQIILAGGAAFVLAAFLAPLSGTFILLVTAYTLFFPASGAFVGLSQTVLMDLDPTRREQNMARWTFAGSIGLVAGPLLFGGAAGLGFGWRIPLLGVSVLAFLTLGAAWLAFTRYSVTPEAEKVPHPNFFAGLKFAWDALHSGEVVRWLALLELSDLMMGVFYSYLALYLVDVAQLSASTAALGVATWTGLGLLGDFLIIPLLERVRGLAYMRINTLLKLCLFPIFLLTPAIPLKFILLGLLGLLNAGWYSILKGQLYAALPGKSGTVMALKSITGLAGRLIPLLIGLAAQQFGLGAAMWILLPGPIALVVGLPRR